MTIIKFMSTLHFAVVDFIIWPQLNFYQLHTFFCGAMLAIVQSKVSPKYKLPVRILVNS